MIKPVEMLSLFIGCCRHSTCFRWLCTFVTSHVYISIKHCRFCRLHRLQFSSIANEFGGWNLPVVFGNSRAAGSNEIPNQSTTQPEKRVREPTQTRLKRRRHAWWRWIVSASSEFLVKRTAQNETERGRKKGLVHLNMWKWCFIMSSQNECDGWWRAHPLYIERQHKVIMV